MLRSVLALLKIFINLGQTRFFPLFGNIFPKIILPNSLTYFGFYHFKQAKRYQFYEFPTNINYYFLSTFLSETIMRFFNKFPQNIAKVIIYTYS